MLRPLRPGPGREAGEVELWVDLELDGRSHSYRCVGESSRLTESSHFPLGLKPTLLLSDC